MTTILCWRKNKVNLGLFLHSLKSNFLNKLCWLTTKITGIIHLTGNVQPTFCLLLNTFFNCCDINVSLIDNLKRKYNMQTFYTTLHIWKYVTKCNRFIHLLRRKVILKYLRARFKICTYMSILIWTTWKRFYDWFSKYISNDALSVNINRLILNWGIVCDFRT